MFYCSYYLIYFTLSHSLLIIAVIIHSVSILIVLADCHDPYPYPCPTTCPPPGGLSSSRLLVFLLILLSSLASLIIEHTLSWLGLVQASNPDQKCLTAKMHHLTSVQISRMKLRLFAIVFSYLLCTPFEARRAEALP